MHQRWSAPPKATYDTIVGAAAPGRPREPAHRPHRAIRCDERQAPGTRRPRPPWPPSAVSWGRAVASASSPPTIPEARAAVAHAGARAGQLVGAPVGCVPRSLSMYCERRSSRYGACDSDVDDPLTVADWRPAALRASLVARRWPRSRMTCNGYGPDWRLYAAGVPACRGRPNALCAAAAARAGGQAARLSQPVCELVTAPVAAEAAGLGALGRDVPAYDDRACSGPP